MYDYMVRMYPIHYGIIAVINFIMVHTSRMSSTFQKVLMDQHVRIQSAQNALILDNPIPIGLQCFQHWFVD